jgi:hypothetical protein
LTHTGFDAISSPAYSRQADKAASTQAGAVYVFLETHGLDHPYANGRDQHTTKSYNREACDKGAATP